MATGDRTKSTKRRSRERKPAFDRVFERIYRIVLRIPRGSVMTYGQIARALGDRYSPRLVGWALHATPHDDRNIPWHRVINSRGAISTGRVIVQNPDLQRWMLEAEGIAFDEGGRCNLSLYQWAPGRRKPRAKLAARRRGGAKPRESAVPSKRK